MPALLTSTSTAPSAFVVSSTSRAASVGSPTSQRLKRAAAPSFFASASPRLALISASTTFAPSAMKRLAQASPMPRAPPVTITTRLSKRMSGADPASFQLRTDLVEDRRIIDGRRHIPGLPVGDLLHRAAQDLARARFRQAIDGNCELEGGDRTDLLAHQRDNLPF